MAKQYRVGKNTFKTELMIECNNKQAEVAYDKLEYLFIKHVFVKENKTAKIIIKHSEKFINEVKIIKTIKELFLLEKKIKKCSMAPLLKQLSRDGKYQSLLLVSRKWDEFKLDSLCSYPFGVESFDELIRGICDNEKKIDEIYEKVIFWLENSPFFKRQS